ncbi:MAG: 7TM-DISM domain-containing protein [Chitinophagaceae bacterium]|nr:7TM-DISM domain-containing protein [Chitinophagaceae bacterium]
MALNGQEIIEYFALGAATITCFYHAILYVQQRDRFILLYANYLFALAIYLLFRRITHYDSFEISSNRFAYALDYPIILYMLVSYVLFISKVLQINNNAVVIKLAVQLFYITAGVLLMIHLYKLIFTDECYLSRTFFLASKLALSGCAFLGLFGAWHVRKTIFIRTIITGGFAYAIFSLLTIFSVYFQVKFIGLYQYQLYFVGCLIDILIFSSALGYRNYLNQKEKMETQDLLFAEGEKMQVMMEQQQRLLRDENARQQNLIRMHQTLQDEVGASLSSIHVFADLSLQLQEKHQDARPHTVKVVQQTRQLMDNIGDIIWLANINVDENAHEQFITRVKNYGQEIVQSNHKICEYKINTYFHQSKLSKEFLKESLIQIKDRMKQCVQDIQSDRLTIVFDCDKLKPFVTIV